VRSADFAILQNRQIHEKQIYKIPFSALCFPFSVTAVIRKGGVSRPKNPLPGEDVKKLNSQKSKFS